jgi:hypothetical protein
MYEREQEGEKKSSSRMGMLILTARILVWLILWQSWLKFSIQMALILAIRERLGNL